MNVTQNTISARQERNQRERRPARRQNVTHDHHWLNYYEALPKLVELTMIHIRQPTGRPEPTLKYIMFAIRRSKLVTLPRMDESESASIQDVHEEMLTRFDAMTTKFDATTTELRRDTDKLGKRRHCRHFDRVQYGRRPVFSRSRHRTRHYTDAGSNYTAYNASIHQTTRASDKT